MINKIKKAFDGFVSVLFVLIMALTLLIVGSKVCGMHLFTVLTGSMEPTYRTGSLILVQPTAAGVNWLHIDTASSPWIWEQPVTAEINGITYTLYCANYPEALASDAVAEPSLLGVWVDSMVDFDGTSYYLGNSTLGSLPDFHILVCTQAVQTTTFDNATDGLLTTFGAISADNHPWAD